MHDADTGIYMEKETLGNFARNTAASLEPEGSVGGAREAKRVMAVLRALRARLTPRAPGGEESEAGEWFSDNWYVAEREGKAAARAMRGAGRLPRAAGTKRACVSLAAAALVRSGRGEVTGERLELFLREYQKARPLAERELAAFVPALMAEECAFLESVPADGADAALLMKNIFTSLRTLAAQDLTEILEGVDLTEAALMRDPAGVYPRMDEETRRDYRRELSRLARRRGLSEPDAARRVLELAQKGADGERHVGTWIFERPLGERKRGRTGEGYIAALVVTTLFFSVLAGVLTGSPLTALLSLVPVFELVKTALDAALLRLVRPKRLPRMELPGGVPKTAGVVCVISALLTGEGDGEKYARALEEYRLANRDAGENVFYGVLADLPEAKTRRTGDDERVLAKAKAAIDGLNGKYGGGFCLFCREREKNEAAGVYMGRERKRGAIEELAKFLSGESSALRVLAGDAGKLRGLPFILTLDADTRPAAGSVRELVGAALHPLNTPRIDEQKGRVVSGYGIFEPRVSVDLKSAGRTDFARIFAGVGGLDPYGSAVSDLYQDLFGEGTFMGKGLINVPVYRRVLEGVFPDNAVLSHDILEGAYMRCAYVSDVEFTDGWPGKVTSYFARLERWTRGDWQNLRWCARRVRGRDGTLRRNRLGTLSRFKLFDNLRRSLLAPVLWLCLLLWAVFPAPATVTAGLTGLAAYLAGALLRFLEDFLRHDGSAGARYQSAVLPGPGGAVMRSLVRLMLLPAEAWTQARAAVTALWRTYVTHRRQLAWVTSGDADRRRSNTLAVNYRELLACPVSALPLAAARTPAWLALALVWLFTPAYAWALSREIPARRQTSLRDRTYLLARAGEIWRFFAENLTAENHYLPPDNVQLSPKLGPARRTSPTNIGFAILSCIAAADLGLIGESEASERVERTLGTVEGMEKWRGHLYNWVDTRTLAPLEPRYVSTVDSGNLAGALIAAEAWFRARGDGDAAARCEKLVVSTDFTPLFDEKRRLFRIGYDFLKDAPTEGWYDLLASEARQTSYIAVALGQVPRRHWRRLGRALVSQDGYSGMASWTGTMFEYLMPNLLLPCEPSSLLYESSRFCLYAQKRAHPGLPWGVSESCFYAFDPGLAYRYKAHGVQRLALRRGMGAEAVVSPYSSYLALSLDPEGAAENLRKLDALGASGPYGHYEAVDFTAARVREEGKGEVVRCYMAHHLGMSLVAVANALCGGVFPRRFMADRRMAAFRELLEERLPTGPVTLRQPPRDIPAVPGRREAGGVSRAFSELDAVTPACVPLSSGEYTVLFAESGKTRSRWRGLDIAAFDPAPDGEAGVEMLLRTPAGTLPVAPARSDGKIRYDCELTDRYGRLRARMPGYAATLTVTVPPSGAGEVRALEITAPAGVGEVTAVLSFEPVLRRRADYEAHPAFNRLTLEAAVEDGAVTVTRRVRTGEAGVSVAVASDRELVATTHRRRGDMPESGELLPYSPDMRLAVAVTVPLERGRGSAVFAIAAGETREDAARSARRMVAHREPEPLSRLGAAALMLGMKPSDTRAALELVTPLVFGGQARARPEFGREELWRAGISGDIPVLGARVGNAGEMAAALELVRRHALLAENGVESDLLLVLTDNGDYAASQRSAVMDLLRRLGRESTLDAPGGVHLAADPAPALALADATADLAAPAAPPRHRSRPAPAGRECVFTGSAACRLGPDNEALIALRDALPPAPWSHVLANPDYGYLATECGAGFQWHRNSRLFKISPWAADARRTAGPETLELSGPEGAESLFADGGAAPTLVGYGFGWARWERELGEVKSRVTAFVPWQTNARVLVAELTGDLEGLEIAYSCKLLLGESARDARYVRLAFDGTAYTAVNVSGEFRNIPYTLLLSEKPEDASAGNTIAFTLPAKSRLVLVSGCDGREKLEAALRDAGGLLEDTKARWKALTSALAVETGEARIDAYVNGWALYQIRACRMLARTGLYQNGGAVGFRDQLQDAAAMTLISREPAVWQLRQAAAHEYEEGDVMHWWHPTPAGDKGVRTRCSDDLLWLCWALADYVERTGDESVLAAREPYRVSKPLEPGERDRYETPAVSAGTDTLLNHAIRAADCFLRRGTGEHGLALILGGDWNDGMDRVGAEGKGESVWLTFFASLTLRKLGALCAGAGESGDAARFERASARLLRAGEGAYAGEWYLRGYYDDGAPLGAPGDASCEIDCVAQSFAHFAGADRVRVKKALRSAAARLYDRESRTVALFTPPFRDGGADPGYIRSCAPGTRENGGQYTHAAVWLAMALLETGERELGAKMLADLSPWGRDAETYAAEPYVLCADVYTAPGLAGRGGWSWYTGSAGWYFRAVTESLLGLKLRGGVLTVEPNLPESLYPVHVVLSLESGPLDIRYYPEGVLVNGEPCRKEGYPAAREKTAESAGA